jgi:hypothetical protein
MRKVVKAKKPQDANVRAAVSRHVALEARVELLETTVIKLLRQVKVLSAAVPSGAVRSS